MRYNNCCDSRNTCGPTPITRTIYRTVVGPTGATGPTGPTGATGPAGTTEVLEASINRNDTTQTVAENNVVSITGTNVLTEIDGDMLFVNNTVRLESGGVYLINATIEASGTAGSYDMAINVNGTDYRFVVTINTGETAGTTSHTIFLNISTTPTTVSIYNRDSDSVTIEKAELDVVKLA